VPTEISVCRLATARGYRVCKSPRERVPDFEIFGRYMLVDMARGIVVLGARYDASLDDIAAFLG